MTPSTTSTHPVSTAHRRVARLLAVLAILTAPLATHAQTPTPPTPPPPPSSWHHHHSDDDDEDYSEIGRDVSRAAREASKAAAEASREAAHEARIAVAEAMPQAMQAERDAIRSVGPTVHEMTREWRNDRKWRDAQDGDDNDDEVTIDTTVTFSSSGGVADLGLLTGEITVRGWSRPEARIHAHSESGPITFDHTPSHLSLDSHHSSDECEFDVTVPYGTRVLMRSNSGDIHYLSVQGETEARTVSGGVDISDTKGSTTVETVSGDLRARHVEGALRVNTISGGIEAAMVTGDAELSSVSGDISLLDATSRTVRMESVSGTETYSGNIDPAGRYDFRSHSGDITLRIPAETNASLSLGTFSGDIDTDFKLSLHASPGADGHRSGSHIDTTIGNGGGAHISIETFSGDARIQRRSHSE
jgi:DUF4097 and DUF4098 domain-containing protein YvlB